ncbi:MAG: hypothetical protein RL385_5492, partial [Pseudomonadota bacterium]
MKRPQQAPPRAVDRLSIVGHGKVGRALARAFRRGGLQVQVVRGRGSSAGRTPLASTVLVCVPDASIAAVAARIAPRLPPAAVVFHCAGARGPDELARCRAYGAAVATLHPLASFADPKHPPVLSNVTFVADGDKRALQRSRALVRRVGAHWAQADLSGATYHAAAALVANGAAGLAYAALEALETTGMDERTARTALAGLLISVAENIRDLGLPAALTGPIARGDAATVRFHLEAWQQNVPRHAPTYAALVPVILRCAEAQGLAPAAARRIRAARLP